MNSTKKKKLLRGLCGISALILSLTVCGTKSMYDWEPLVNDVLGISSSTSISGGEVTDDSIYGNSK